MEATLGRLERRVRADLDVRRRLRRDGPRVAATAGIVIAVGASLWLTRRRHRGGAEPATPAEWFAGMPPEWQAQLRALVDEAGGASAAADGRRPGRRGGRPLWQTAALTSARIIVPRLLAARRPGRAPGPAEPAAAWPVDGADGQGA